MKQYVFRSITVQEIVIEAETDEEAMERWETADFEPYTVFEDVYFSETRDMPAEAEEEPAGEGC